MCTLTLTNGNEIVKGVLNHIVPSQSQITELNVRRESSSLLGLLWVILHVVTRLRIRYGTDYGLVVKPKGIVPKD